MKLERIKIEGYRSLKSVEWKPEPLNVLIGANASGKSNFLQALELLPAAANGELERTILDRGGMAPLLWDGRARELAIEVDLGELAYTMRLSRLGDSGSYEFADESIVRGSTQLMLEDLPGKRYEREAAVSHRFADERITKLSDFFSSWAIYPNLRTDPTAEVRRSAVTRHETRLAPDGGNLVSVLLTLYNGNREFEELVDSAMLAAFPDDYEKLTFTPLEDGRVSLRVRWKNSGRQPTAADLSDGTLRFLMVLAVLANPTPGPLIAIDEPETGLHPGMLPIVTELSQQAATKSEVILTTHSPEFLDTFAHERLPATTVFQWKDDHTQMSTLTGEKLEYWIKDYSLGRFAFSGEAEAVS